MVQPLQCSLHKDNVEQQGGWVLLVGDGSHDHHHNNNHAQDNNWYVCNACMLIDTMLYMDMLFCRCCDEHLANKPFMASTTAGTSKGTTEPYYYYSYAAYAYYQNQLGKYDTQLAYMCTQL